MPWSSKWYLKFGNLYYFGFVVAVLVGCACSIIIAIARRRSNSIALSLEAQFLFAGIVWIVWQSNGQTALQPDYFAYPLYPPMFFALAAIAASWRRVEIPSKESYFALRGTRRGPLLLHVISRDERRTCSIW